MDYALPRATDIPPIAFRNEPLPSTANQIGIKAAGRPALWALCPLLPTPHLMRSGR